MGSPIIQPILSPPVGPIITVTKPSTWTIQTMNGKPGTTWRNGTLKVAMSLTKRAVTSYLLSRNITTMIMAHRVVASLPTVSPASIVMPKSCWCMPKPPLVQPTAWIRKLSRLFRKYRNVPDMQTANWLPLPTPPLSPLQCPMSEDGNSLPKWSVGSN